MWEGDCVCGTPKWHVYSTLLLFWLAGAVSVAIIFGSRDIVDARNLVIPAIIGYYIILTLNDNLRNRKIIFFGSMISMVLDRVAIGMLPPPFG